MRGIARLPNSERMSDDMERSRSDMILGGLDFENEQKIVQAKFDLYSRSDGDVENRIDMYNQNIKSIMPYVDFNLSSSAEETEEEKRKNFVGMFKSIDWNEVINELPIKK